MKFHYSFDLSGDNFWDIFTIGEAPWITAALYLGSLYKDEKNDFHLNVSSKSNESLRVDIPSKKAKDAIRKSKIFLEDYFLQQPWYNLD